jgi:hypothetical protein
MSAELFYADRRTDMTKLIDDLRNFSKSHKNVKFERLFYAIGSQITDSLSKST